MKDKKEKEINNDLFDFTSNLEQDIIKKAKKKSYIKIATISGGICVLALTLGVVSKIQITPFLVSKQVVSAEYYYDLVGVNAFLGQWDEQNKLFSTSATAPKYKLIGDKPVYIGEMDINKIDYEQHLITNENQTYSYLGHRIMQFYHPFVKYNEYSNDIDKIDEIEGNKNIEMGLSFNKQYTLEELENIIPKDVNINWLWVDNFRGDTLDAIKEFDNGITHQEAQILDETRVIGFSTIQENGESIPDPIDYFITNIERGKDVPGKYKKDINDIYESLIYNNKGIEKDDIKIIGAVVVSDKEGMSKLKDLEFIKSSSFGVISDKY